ncbi:MAG: SDR family oxidoreductase [Rhodospirillaceae bacterium]|nr:SDR family oxidoreductase [Rhodospirillaceae bacterium]
MDAASGLMAGKRGLVMGVANERSLAYGIARAAHRQGAELAFTYQAEAFGRRAIPLCEELGSKLVLEADVEQPASLDAVFARLAAEWGRLDFVVHSLAFSDREELKGRYVDTTRGNFLRTLDISCYSFTDIARRAEPLLTDGGAILTLTFEGARRVFASYNVMGVAKAALEASVRYLASDLGKKGIRVNALSAGPMRTLAGAGVGDARYVYGWTQANAPLRRNPQLDEVGNAGLYLVSPLSAGVTGEIHSVDCGYSLVGMGIVPEKG